MNDLRSRLGLKPDAAPLPGEAAYEDTEIGRAPGQLPAASPFESTVPTKFRVISYDESNCKVARAWWKFGGLMSICSPP